MASATTDAENPLAPVAGITGMGHLHYLSDSCRWSTSTHTGPPSSWDLVLEALTHTPGRESYTDR